jgi:hypothetical protein
MLESKSMLFFNQAEIISDNINQAINGYAIYQMNGWLGEMLKLGKKLVKQTSK